VAAQQGFAAQALVARGSPPIYATSAQGLASASTQQAFDGHGIPTPPAGPDDKATTTKQQYLAESLEHHPDGSGI